jgi:hypothetical protein
VSGNENALKFVSQSGGTVSPYVASGAGGISFPIGFVVGADSNLYVASYGNDKIARFAPNGNSLGDFVAAGSGGLNGPNFMIFRPPTVSITRAGTDLKISWPAQSNSRFQLVKSDTPNFVAIEIVNGAIVNPNGTNEVTLLVEGAMKFFRVQY